MGFRVSVKDTRGELREYVVPFALAIHPKPCGLSMNPTLFTLHPKAIHEKLVRLI